MRKYIPLIAFVGTLAVVAGFRSSGGHTGTENPHEGLNEKFLTSWGHSSPQRFPQPNVIREAWEATNYRSVIDRNPDRPSTSKVTPVMVNPLSFGERKRYFMDTEFDPPIYMGTEEDLLAAHFLLEEYQLEFFPTPKRNNGRKYKFNKNFNFDDVSQWRVHHGARWVKGVDDIGRPVEFVSLKRDATDLCVAGYDVRGKPYSFMEPDGECEAFKIKWRPENYSIFLDYREDGGLAFGSHISNLNYTKHGHVRSDGNNAVSIQEGTFPNEKSTIVFHQRHGMIDFDDRYIETNDQGEEFLRVRVVSDRYGDVKYLPLMTAEEARL